MQGRPPRWALGTWPTCGLDECQKGTEEGEEGSRIIFLAIVWSNLLIKSQCRAD